MTAKKALLALLLISFVMETVLTAAGFIAPVWMLGQFKIGVTPDTQFMGFVVAWLLLFVTLVIGLAYWLVRKNSALGWGLCYLLGFWWVLFFQKSHDLAARPGARASFLEDREPFMPVFAAPLEN